MLGGTGRGTHVPQDDVEYPTPKPFRICIGMLRTHYHVNLSRPASLDDSGDGFRIPCAPQLEIHDVIARRRLECRASLTVKDYDRVLVKEPQELRGGRKEIATPVGSAQGSSKEPDCFASVSSVTRFNPSWFNRSKLVRGD